ncbi:MAG: hypothetical protein DI598_01495 [Pseudopedobacter saltans]|uniref:Lipoprotein n=1 Tax=Pseudopedobacter saltans TaxID=151895 RepID=A0A2W5H249_9SPHI|nr:MAG: hypothetical protein DI598_01495 [Pseudopedobacter saltans]
MKKTFFWTSTLIIVASCNNTNKPSSEKTEPSPIEILMDSVMHGHDQGMGKIGRVEKAAQELSHKIDSIKQTKNVNKPLLATWESAKKNLDLADSSMNKWMDSFDMDMDGMDSTTKIKYLQNNQKWVNGIADSLKIALNTADSLLKK